jgi:polyisoprenoid-binding protein YceI
MERAEVSMTLFLALFLTACVEDVSKGKTDVVMNAPASAEAPAAAPARANAPASVQELPIDVAQSDIHAVGAKVTGTETVRFTKWSGVARVAGGKVQAVNVDIDVNSLDTGKGKLNQHLASADFFDAEKYPKATFQSISIQEGSTESGMTHTVTGDLTMRGVTKSVTFPMKLEVSDDRVTGETEFAINRMDWNIAWPGAPDNLIQDKVVLTVKLVAPNPNATAAR